MRISKVSFAYDEKDILDDMSFEIKKGRITAVLGANGSGKSTLFSVLTKMYKPQKGNIYLDGKNIAEIHRKDFHKEVAVVHQKNTAADDMTVSQLVSYGRIPHMKIFKRKSREDEQAIKWALRATGMEAYAEYEMGKLSGGQQQRAYIAMALAQKTKILFLDEPTTFLDIRYQIEILELVKKINKEHNITIVMILHDINQAICYSDEILGLKDGQVQMQGSAIEAVSEAVIEKLYGIRLKVGEIENRPFVWNIRKE